MTVMLLGRLVVRQDLPTDEFEVARWSNSAEVTEGEAFGGGWSGPQFVLTHNKSPKPAPGVTFVHDIASAITESKAAAGEKYVNVIGAEVARGLVAAGALDEVLTVVTPVLLGDGVRLFDQPGGLTVRLERIHVSHAEQATNIWVPRDQLTAIKLTHCPTRLEMKLAGTQPTQGNQRWLSRPGW